MNTELSRDRSPSGQIDRLLERSFSKAFFIKHFLRGDTQRAERMGVRYTAIDRKLALVAAVRIFAQLRIYEALATLPVAREVADMRLIGKLRHRLNTYGRADFATDAGPDRPPPGDDGDHKARPAA